MKATRHARCFGNIRLVMMFALTALAIIIVFALVAIKSSRRNTLEDESRNMANTSQLLTAHIQRVMFSADLHVTALIEGIDTGALRDAHVFHAYASSRRVFERMQSLLNLCTDVDAFGFADAQGRMYTSRAWPSTIDISERSYFRALRDNPKLPFVVSEMVKSRVTGQQVFLLVRPVVARDGSLLGIAGATMSISRFEKLFAQSSPAADTSFYLFRRDGALIAKQTGSDTPDLHAGALWDKAGDMMQKKDSVNLFYREDSQPPRLAALNNVQGYPMTLAMTRSEAAALAEWKKLAMLIELFATVSSLLVLFAVWAFRRQIRARQAVVSAAQQLEVAHQEIQSAHHRLTETQTLAHMGHWELELASQQLTWSDEVFRILRMDKGAERASYQAFLQLVHPDDRRAVDHAYAEAMNTHVPYEINYRLLFADGQIKWIIERCRTEVDAGGKAAYFTGSIQDVTSLKSVEEELRIARNAAEAANVAKSEFLANMSHEIRTPMNSVMGMAYLVLKTGLNTRQRDLVAKIYQSAYRLLGIINDILDFSKIEAGKLNIEQVDFQLGGIMNHLSSQMEIEFLRKNLRLRFEIDEELSRPFRGDPLRLGQVLTNFVSNAVKFTDQGEIVVAVHVVEAGEQDALLRFDVRDTGIGMSAGQISNIFNMFQQGDATITRKYGGTGLGLAICKRLVQMMGGEIGVESQPGKGSTFWFRVRMQYGDEAAVLHETLLVNGVTFPNSTILLVEDNLFNQQVAQGLLESCGAQVVLASNGEEALDLVRRQHFDCVLMDVQMPVMDGYEATRKIRAIPDLQDLCIIALTANVGSDDLERCREAGMNDFIAKPIVPKLMYSILAKWLEVKHIPMPELASVPLDGLGKGDLSVMDLTVLAETWGNNRARIIQYAKSFAETLQDNMLKIEQAIATGNMEELNLYGHSCKSSARTMGAVAYGELCEVLEKCKHPADLEKAREIVAKMHPLLKQILEEVGKL